MLRVAIELDDAARKALEQLDLAAPVFGDKIADPLPAELQDLLERGWKLDRSQNRLEVTHAFTAASHLPEVAAQLSGVGLSVALIPVIELTNERDLWRNRMRLHAVVAPGEDWLLHMIGTGLENPPTLEELERALGAPIREFVGVTFGVSMPDVDRIVVDPPDAPRLGRDIWQVPIGTTLTVTVEAAAPAPAFWIALVAGSATAMVVLVPAFVELCRRRRKWCLGRRRADVLDGRTGED